MTDNSALRPDALTPKEITEKVLGLGVTKSSMGLYGNMNERYW